MEFGKLTVGEAVRGLQAGGFDGAAEYFDRFRLVTSLLAVMIITAQRTRPLPTEDPFEMPKHVHVKVRTPAEEEKHAEAAKITRLRALRLAKEAADRDAATREIAAPLARSRGHQSNPKKSPR